MVNVCVCAPGFRHIITLVGTILALSSRLCGGLACSNGRNDVVINSTFGGPPVFSDLSVKTDLKVIRGHYVEMPCEASNFCTVEWIKDAGITYPFGFRNGETLDHVHFAGEENQTLQIRKAFSDAIGVYTCTVYGSEQSIQRTFRLTVEEEPFTNNPVPLHHANCSNKRASPGSDVYIYCEFCTQDKTNKTQLQWFFQDAGTMVPVSHLSSGNGAYKDELVYETTLKHTKECVKRATDPQSVGKELVIRHVTPRAYGSYVLLANYTLNGEIKNASVTVALSAAQGPMMNRAQTIAVVVSMATLFITVTVVTVACYVHHLTLQLYWKNKFGEVEEQDGNRFDAFISYSDTDVDLRFTLYLRKLLQQSNYEVWLRDVDAQCGEVLIAEEIEQMKQSRRCILVISPDYPDSPHSQVLTELAVDQTLKQKSKIIPILYRNANRQEIKRHSHLAEIIKVLPCITWTDTGGRGPEVEAEKEEEEESPTSDGSAMCSDGHGRDTSDLRHPGGDCADPSSGGDDENGASSGGRRTIKMTSSIGRKGNYCRFSDDHHEQEIRKKRTKLQEKCEKKLLLRMPPKRLPASNARNNIV